MALMKKSQYDRDFDGKVDADAIANHQHSVTDLLDHDKAAHDVLGIDADTVDGQHASAFELVANKGVANGYAPLDANAQVPVANLPDAVKTSNLVNQTANRSAGTVYQNTTGKHLLVMVIADIGAGTYTRAKGRISSDNIAWYDIAWNETGNVSDTSAAFIAFVVPPNYYYAVYVATGNRIYRWYEVTI